MRCNVLGDIQAHDTIKVSPGDNLTFDWHHELRNTTDEVIAYSHHGPSLIYISPDPPTNSSFVKLWHAGKIQSNPFPQPGKWSTTADIRANYGRMNVRVPAGLKTGPYLIRAEMIGLHEGDVSFAQNPRRGAQFYPDCVQIEVVGGGEVELPEGVGFPGAYSYEDPGVVHNVRLTGSFPFLVADCVGDIVVYTDVRVRFTARLKLRNQRGPLPPVPLTTLFQVRRCGRVRGRRRRPLRWAPSRVLRRRPRGARGLGLIAW